MEDPETQTLYTIDANVRTALSMLLYLFKGHMYEKRGFGSCLVYECVFMKISREEFEDHFSKAFHESRIILLGSTRMGEKDVWAYGMVLAGESQVEIDQLSDRILEFEVAPSVED